MSQPREAEPGALASKVVANSTEAPTKRFVDRIGGYALGLHVVAGGLVLLWSIDDPRGLARSPFLALFVDSANVVFGVVENTYLCKPLTAAGVAIVATVTTTAHLMWIAFVIRDRKVISDSRDWAGSTYLDKTRVILAAAFGVALYMFSFHWRGGPDTTPGFVVLCMPPAKLWFFWTIQAAVTVVVVHICLGPIYELLYLAAQRLRIVKG